MGSRNSKVKQKRTGNDIFLSNIQEISIGICIVACLIKLMCMQTNSLKASNYAIGAKGRYLYLWVLAGCGYLWVAGNLYEMRGGCG